MLLVWKPSFENYGTKGIRSHTKDFWQYRGTLRFLIASLKTGYCVWLCACTQHSSSSLGRFRTGEGGKLNFTRVGFHIKKIWWQSSQWSRTRRYYLNLASMKKCGYNMRTLKLKNNLEMGWHKCRSIVQYTASIHIVYQEIQNHIRTHLVRKILPEF